MTFKVDNDAFTINLDNGYTLTFEPCDLRGIPAHLQPGFKDDDHAKPQPQLRMIVTGNGTNVRHNVLDAGELGLQIQSFAQKPRPKVG